MASPQAPAPKLTDCHVHLLALPEADNGCYVSRKLLRSPLARNLIRKHGLDVNHPAKSNQKYVDDLIGELRTSKFVGKAVLLGMDGAYDAHGQFDRERTDFVISNDYVLKVVKAYPNDFLAGVSINPQRRDAVDELERCAAAGARLVKVLPNSQQFDPADKRHIPFYRALARLGVPFLSHVGYEFSLIGKDQSAGDPARLRVPLDEGATVIAAHGCSYGLLFYEKYYPMFLELTQKYARFFADISALTLPNRFRMMLRLRKHPEVHHRLLFGTDYPLPVFRWPWRGPLRGLGELMSTTNRFDRQYLVCQRLGVGFASLESVEGAAK
ncbi:MAG: amidohydrolase family protein [Acidobacteria bacterium]|nr:amidohydrolase family protein [Acidobacteriota bacterium]